MRYARARRRRFGWQCSRHVFSLSWTISTQWNNTVNKKWFILLIFIQHTIFTTVVVGLLRSWAPKQFPCPYLDWEPERYSLMCSVAWFNRHVWFHPSPDQATICVIQIDVSLWITDTWLLIPQGWMEHWTLAFDFSLGSLPLAMPCHQAFWLCP